jgi:hypothetical protein
MDGNKAAYWIALGVFALALHGQYQEGSFVVLHRVSQSAGSVLCRISTRAEQTLAAATGLGRRQAFRADRLLASTDSAAALRQQRQFLREQARNEAELTRDEIRAQTEEIRSQPEMQRADIKMQQIRWPAHPRPRVVTAATRRVVVVCPKTGSRIVVNDLDNDGMDSVPLPPDVEVGDNF